MYKTASATSILEFTFQYASIKPKAIAPDDNKDAEFTFQYASIKPDAKSENNVEG